MAEYTKDYYTRTFVDMLTTLELKLVRYDGIGNDGIGIVDTYDDRDDGERFDSADEVVDYISEQIDDIRDQFEAAVLECDLWDEWDEHCDGVFSYDDMLSFMDKHEDFKDEWVFLIYEPTQMLINHLGDVDLDLAVELTSERSMDYNKVFEDMLDVLDFKLVKYGDGFGLLDLQVGTLGVIASDRFMDAVEVIDRLGIYLNDYYFEDLEEAWDEKGYEGDLPVTAEDWVGFMNEHGDFKEKYRHEYDVMNMIAYHADDVDLNKGFEKERTAEKGAPKEAIERD